MTNVLCGTAFQKHPPVLLYRNVHPTLRGNGVPFSALSEPQVEKETPSMLYWALIFLLVAVVAGALGFGGIAGASAGIAKILFFIFLVLLIVSLIAHVSRGRVP